jgi:RIO-like serine/threonine protein kinase
MDYDSIDSFFLNKHRENLDYAYTLIFNYMTDPEAPIKITSSSGSSIVFLSNESPVVVQIFSDRKLCDRVFTVINSVMHKVCKVPINSAVTEEYTIDDYIVPFELYFPDNNIIMWRRIQTMNSLDDIGKYIVKNYWKFVWDLSHGLQCIHSSGFVHGDCSIDNIGVYNGHFVLFDFDMAKPVTPEGINKDYDTLNKSIFFHTDQRLRSGDIQYVISSFMDRMKIDDVGVAVSSLNNLEISTD